MKLSSSSLVAVLLSGSLLIGIGSAQAADAAKKKVAPKPAPEFNAEAKAKDRVNNVAPKLKLTNDQKQQLLPLYLEETQQLRKETEQSLAARTKIRQDFQAKVKESKILTDAQFAKWLEMQTDQMNQLAKPKPSKAKK